MDIKKIYPGGEPKISNPDLMRMQYSNYYGLQQISGVLGDCIVNGCEVTIDSVTYTEPRVAVLNIANGWAIIGGELVVVDNHKLTINLTGNVPAPGSSWLINMSVESTYDVLGDKIFNDSTPRQTWEKRRGVCTARKSYQADPLPANTFDIALLNVTWSPSPQTATVYMYDDSFTTKNFETNWDDKFAGMTTGNRVVAINSFKNIIDGPNISDLVTKIDSDYVYTKTIALGTWNMTAGYTTTGTGVNKEITLESTGIPSGAKITEMHVTINSDDESIIYTDYNDGSKENGPVYYTTAGTPKFTISNMDKFASSSLWNDTTTNRGYLTIKYILA